MRWKNVVRERVSWDWGTGSGCPAPFPPTHTHASWGAFPSAVWAACTVEGAVLAQEAKTLRGGTLLHSTIPFFPCCLGAVGQVHSGEDLAVSSCHVPWHRFATQRQVFLTHTKDHLDPQCWLLYLLLICLKQNFAK